MPHRHHGLPEGRQVKCPDCGFVSFPQPAECKKCGHRFEPAAPSRGGRFSSQVSFRSRRPTPSPPPETSDPDGPLEPAGELRSSSGQLEPATPPGEGFAAASGSEARAAAARKRAWESEIAARVARYRRRRDGPPHTIDPDDNLEFDFSAADDRNSAAADGRERDELDLLLENDERTGNEAPLI